MAAANQGRFCRIGVGHLGNARSFALPHPPNGTFPSTGKQGIRHREEENRLAHVKIAAGRANKRAAP